ncbi:MULTISPECIES: potassium-transporting ATPase [Mycolicibacterium]|nr:potassium-transporting ATPase [Mycolicibacterium mageritense]MCC9181289.1 potassium-transporting ATPase [Mycolicibacterium mageritense]
MGEPMSVVVFIVLTVAIFSLLGLVQKLVEGL